MSDYDNFKDRKKEYIDRLEQVLQGLHVGDCIAFIKNKRKHILKIIQLQLSPNIEDIKISACGVVWQGGFKSMDGKIINSTTNKSAAGYSVIPETLQGIAYGVVPSEDNESDWPTNQRGQTLGDYEDEFAGTNYIAYYSSKYPLVLDKFVHTNTVNFGDDVLEFCIIDEAIYYMFVRDLTNFEYVNTHTDKSIVGRYNMEP